MIVCTYKWAHLNSARHVTFSTNHMMSAEAISFLYHMTAAQHKEVQEIC